MDIVDVWIMVGIFVHECCGNLHVVQFGCGGPGKSGPTGGSGGAGRGSARAASTGSAAARKWAAVACRGRDEVVGEITRYT